MRTSGMLAVLLVLAGGCTGPADPLDSVLRLTGPVCGRDLVATAVAIDEGLALTNAHSVAGSDANLLLTASGGVAAEAQVVGIDIDRDLALLAAPDLAAPPIATAGIVEGEPGRIVRLLEPPAPATVEYTGADAITVVGHDIYDDESDVRRASVRVVANVGPGWSGAPVLDGAGRMIGMVYAESRRSGFTYAVAASEIEVFLATVDPTTPVATGRCAP